VQRDVSTQEKATAEGQRERTLVDVAIRAIRTRISSSELEPGGRMPPERILVSELGVSRTVVREALSSLEALGLIETRGTRGRYVSSRGSDGDAGTVAEWLRQHNRTIFELDEIRSVLEAHAIETMSEWDAVHAAHDATSILRQQKEAIDRGDPVEAARLDRAFHELLASYSQNTSLKELIGRLAGESRRETLAVYSLPDAAQRSLDQHREIVETLASSDVERAAELARHHMLDAARLFAFPVEEHRIGDGDGRSDGGPSSRS
jgi:GntR family transcriptional repressor for pyruvate dehydrogenase complex